MRLLVLDTETTGLHPETDNLIEVAAVLYHVESKTILQTLQFLEYSDTNPAENINHISALSLQEANISNTQSRLDHLSALFDAADYLVAHNAKFDKGFLYAKYPYFSLKNKKWVCSKENLTFPKASGKSSKLGHLAYDHNIPVFNAHRALTDVHILVDLLSQTPDLAEQVLAMNSPRFTYIANTSYEERELAKNAGFSWNKDTKQWTKVLTEEQAAKISGFKVTKGGVVID